MEGVIWLHNRFSKILELTGRILTGRQFSLEPLYPFLKTGVMLACFRTDGNIPLSIHTLKRWQM